MHGCSADLPGPAVTMARQGARRQGQEAAATPDNAGDSATVSRRDAANTLALSNSIDSDVTAAAAPLLG